MLEEFARHVRQKGLEGRLPGLRAIISTSEPLTAPRRELIRQAFNVPVQNEYGCGEVGPIAYECRAGSLHVMSQSLEVEILSDTGEPCRPGVVGQVVVTDLNNHAFPLIRYAIGDHAAWGRPCACGLPFPVLAELLGRQYDYLEDGAGRRYHGEAVMYIFEDLREEGFDIPAFQVLQHRPGEARLLLVAPTAPARLDEKLREMFRIRLGQMELKIERRDEIPRASSGKRRLIHRLS
jgi:phenylacetate-CoA ligase